MKKVTVLLLGVTGDLAKLKVLPAINDFARRNKDEFETHLIGYSRSKADLGETENSLKKGVSGGDLEVKSIKYIQDAYDNLEQYNQIFESMGEDCRIIIYLAVPPAVFMPFLKSVCPLKPQQISIVIEKPFGRDGEEAKELIDTASHCTLTNSIHFFDHYLFKQSTFLPPEIKSKLSGLGEVKSIKIRAKEELGVQGRAGYYDRTGAFEDMWQHLVSLTNVVADEIDLNLNWTEFKPEDTVIGQYDDYKKDVENPDSQTDSYFKVIGTLDDADFVAESGKRLDEKRTDITIDFASGDVIEWNIDLDRNIKLNGEVIHSWGETNEKISDHTVLLERIINSKLDRFVTNSRVLESWQSYEQIYPIKARTPVMPYKSRTYPPKFIS